MSSGEQLIIETLTEFGLPKNAAKAFVTLLKKNPATGYEIGNRAGIPRSAIYSVLQRLEAMNLVNVVGTSPKRYVPLSPGSLLEQFQRLNKDRIEALQSGFASLNLNEEAFDFWHIHGYSPLISRIKEVIRSCQKQIFLAIWRKEYDLLEGELSEASKRGVDVILFSFSQLSEVFGTVVSYGLDEKDLLEIWNPKVILVADQMVTIMGQAVDSTGNKAVWTNNEAIIEIARNHIILDITLAGRRLQFDANPIVQRIMERAELHLDKLIEERIS